MIFFVMAGLYKSLKVEDYRRESANRDTAPRPLGLQDRLSWKKRLSRLMNYPGTRYTKQMMETVCYPAMEEVAQELRLRGAYVELKSLPPEEGQRLGNGTGFVGAYGRRTKVCLSDLAAAIFGAGLYLTAHVAVNRPTTGWKPSC
ncbi:hypothetical protein ACLBOM_28370 [Escherichia coli]